MSNGKRPITPKERMAAMITIAVITLIIVMLDLAGGGIFGGMLAIIVGLGGIGAICAVLFMGREE